MEAVIAILIVLGVLSASGVLPEKSPKTPSQETHASALQTSEKEIRLACSQHGSVFRDLTMPYEQRAGREAAGQPEATCNE